MEPHGLGACDFYSDYGSVQIGKKQTVVGNAYFKDFFLALPIFLKLAMLKKSL